MSKATVKGTINNVNEHNKFKGIIEFPNIDCARFANVLCKTEDLKQKYLTEYYNPEFEQWEIINSLQDYKRNIRNRRTDVSEYREKIKTCIETENLEWLWVVLQDLFLEPLYKWQVERIVDMIHNGINVDDIMNWHEKDKKILSMICFGVEYVKAI